MWKGLYVGGRQDTSYRDQQHFWSGCQCFGLYKHCIRCDLTLQWLSRRIEARDSEVERVSTPSRQQISQVRGFNCSPLV